MTSPKVATFKTGQGRYYTHPETGEKVPGVTSVVGKLPKPFLRYWAAKMVATAAVEAVADGSTWLADMARSDPEAAIDFLKRAPDRSTREAANIGSAAHAIFDALVFGRPVGELTPEVEPFRRQFEDLLATVQPEPHYAEETVWNSTHGYAGTFDLYATIEGEKCWVDNKTTRSGVYPEVALQLSAYKHAEELVRADGEVLPLPSGDRGLVFHIRPEKWAIYEVPIGEEVFEQFLALRQTFRWEAAARSIVGKPLVVGAA